MDRICYKVVSCQNSEFHSAMYSDLPHEYSLKYEFGVKTIPKIGKIFVFDTLEHAGKFVEEHNGYLAIFSGLATDVGRPKNLCYWYDTFDIFKRFWECKQHKKKLKVELRESPKGTLSCSSFTPHTLVQKGL